MYMAAVCFQKQEVVISQPWIEISLAKFGTRIVFDFLKCFTSPNRKSEVDFRRGSRHPEKSI